MNRAPRHKEMHELTQHLRQIEDRALGFSLYDIPEDMGMADLIVFALKLHDTPDRQTDPAFMREVFEKCGKFGVLAVKDAIMDTQPYVHLGNFHDSLELLQRSGIITIGEHMQYTEAGSQIGAVMLNKIIIGELPVVTSE